MLYEQGLVPTELKQANVSPIFKGGNRKDPSNYRPVSITPIVAKVFESIIYDDLQKFIEDNKVISPKQHGFQKAKSTTTNLIDFWDRVTSIADNGKSLSIIYTDLKKAFDSVPHDLLLAKLEHYGVRGKTYNWIESFLQNRTQKVVVNDEASDYAPVLSGVPQGGILSGMFFILYINDLPQNLKHTEVFMYADDAKLLSEVLNNQSLTEIQQDLDSLHAWCTQWRLALNPKKCYWIHYNPKKTASHRSLLTILLIISELSEKKK